MFRMHGVVIVRIPAFGQMSASTRKINLRQMSGTLYQPEMREKVKKVMRFSGPRLLYRAPGLAFHHVLDGRKKPQTIEEFRRRKRISTQ